MNLGLTVVFCVKLKPLGRSTMSAEELVNLLWQEAEEFRKVKKRNTISGIHKCVSLSCLHRCYVVCWHWLMNDNCVVGVVN